MAEAPDIDAEHLYCDVVDVDYAVSDFDEDLQSIYMIDPEWGLLMVEEFATGVSVNKKADGWTISLGTHMYKTAYGDSIAFERFEGWDGDALLYDLEPYDSDGFVYQVKVFERTGLAVVMTGDGAPDQMLSVLDCRGYERPNYP